MTPARSDGGQDAFWERAGRARSSATMFRSQRVARHVLAKQWRVALDIAGRLGLDASASVLELGCGDGEFAVEVLARHYRHVVALEKSPTAVERAVARPGGDNVRFLTADVVAHEYAAGEHWDGAFLIGFLHHVKRGTPVVVEQLAQGGPEGDRDGAQREQSDAEAARASALVPGGRGRELPPGKELRRDLRAGRIPASRARRDQSFPPFTPDVLFPMVRGVERLVEATRALHALCSSHVLGFAAER